MKILSVLILMLATVLPSWASQTWPASTNANQTFFKTNTFAVPIILQSLTPSTVVVSDASQRPSSFANGTGVFTDDGAGSFSWVLPIDIEFTGAGVSTNLIGNLLVVTIPGDAADIVTLSNNLITTINSTSNSILSQMTNSINSTSNSILSQVTNSLTSLSNSIISQVATNTVYYTNLSTMAPDFKKGYAAITTNASFAFLLPLNLDATKTIVQTAVVRVDNSSGSAIVATPPANVIVISNSFMGVGANGTTWFTFVRYPPDRTNVYANAETH